MRRFVYIIVPISILFSTAACSYAKAWRGIVPLKSTRADVERLLGPPTGRLSTYYLPDSTVDFTYSTCSCGEDCKKDDWNVRPDTVIGIRVGMKGLVKLADLKIDLREFEKWPGDEDVPGDFSYVNKKEGFAIDTGSSGYVSALSYGPRADDDHLRCPSRSGADILGTQRPGWRGIIPLHSTRSDIEHLYGVSSDSCRCNFQTSQVAIHVAFATASCAGPIFGWNVPRDTVLEFSVTPNIPPKFSEMTWDLDGFAKRYSPEDIVTTYYTNVDKGIVLSVQGGHVFHTDYFPPRKENGKRCEGFPPYDGVPPGRPFDTIFNKSKDEVYARLDNFAYELSTNTQMRGYIITYAGKTSRRGEAKEMADGARRYLIDKRMISPDRVITIDGGFRETAEYELFSFSPRLPPPTPTPTVPSNEVQIVRTTTRNKRRLPKTHYK